PEPAPELEKERIRAENGPGGRVLPRVQLGGIHAEDAAVPHEVAAALRAERPPQEAESGHVVVEPERPGEEDAKGGGLGRIAALLGQAALDEHSGGEQQRRVEQEAHDGVPSLMTGAWAPRRPTSACPVPSTDHCRSSISMWMSACSVLVHTAAPPSGSVYPRLTQRSAGWSTRMSTLRPPMRPSSCQCCRPSVVRIRSDGRLPVGQSFPSIRKRTNASGASLFRPGLCDTAVTASNTSPSPRSAWIQPQRLALPCP